MIIGWFSEKPDIFDFEQLGTAACNSSLEDLSPCYKGAEADFPTKWKVNVFSDPSFPLLASSLRWSKGRHWPVWGRDNLPLRGLDSFMCYEETGIATPKSVEQRNPVPSGKHGRKIPHFRWFSLRTKPPSQEASSTGACGWAVRWRSWVSQLKTGLACGERFAMALWLMGSDLRWEQASKGGRIQPA